MKIHRLSVVLFFIAIAFYLFGNALLPISDPVESNYALTAKEMVTSGNWLSPQIYGTFWYDKPIMIYWLIAASYKIFGFTAFAARFPGALFGALSVAFLYQLVRTISGRRIISLWSALVLGTSLEFWVLAHGIVTDMVLMTFTIGTMGYALRGLLEKKPRLIAVAYAFAGLGVLTKGPVAIVLPGLLLLAFALTERSWTMVKALFPWQGILAFCAVTLPWYSYMYYAHGQAFIDGFIGLNNVVRATQSEHPEDNHWYYYLVVFILASLPWTGALLYGMVRGWKERTTFYNYCMIWGWGTILFYSLMATKYVTYTFISLIPFSVLAGMGIVRLTRVGVKRRHWWWMVGPAIFLWSLYLAATFFVGWGWWVLFYVIYAVGIICIVGTFYNKSRHTMPLILAAVTMLLSNILVYEGLTHYVARRSSMSIVPVVQSYDGDVYYYHNMSTSMVFYTGRDIAVIQPADTNPAHTMTTQRSQAWLGKYKYKTVSAETMLTELQAGKRVLIIVPEGEGMKLFSHSELRNYVHLVERTSRFIIYEAGATADAQTAQ